MQASFIFNFFHFTDDFQLLNLCNMCGGTTDLAWPETHQVGSCEDLIARTNSF